MYKNNLDFFKYLLFSFINLNNPILWCFFNPKCVKFGVKEVLIRVNCVKFGVNCVKFGVKNL